MVVAAVTEEAARIRMAVAPPRTAVALPRPVAADRPSVTVTPSRAPTRPTARNRPSAPTETVRWHASSHTLRDPLVHAMAKERRVQLRVALVRAYKCEREVHRRQPARR